jgi:phenylalanyl-tRNA synthetase alpha chain
MIYIIIKSCMKEEKELVKKLHPHEKRILLALRKLRRASTGEIASEASLPEASIHKAGMWTKVKGLTEDEEETKEEATLTKEGKLYAKEGLPEKKLIKELSSKEKKLSKLRTENLNICLSWAKKKGWIELKAGKARITDKGREALDVKDELEEALLHNKLEGRQLEEAKTRKLVKVKKIKHKKFKLTEKGKKIAGHIKKVLPEAGRLSPEDIRTGKWKALRFRPYDVNMPSPTLLQGRIHPYVRFINSVRSKLIAMGFQEAKGPWVETEFWNFDPLFVPQDHPAKGIHDVFKMKNPKTGMIKDKRSMKRVALTHKNGWITGSSGWGFWNPKSSLNLVLRSQTTSVSARTIAELKPETGKFFTIDRVFRPDVLDASHSFEFNQCEGIVIGENLTFKHLLGYMEELAKAMGVEKVKFKPGYFPFTEPSVEGFIKHPELGWIEAMPGGIFRPEVTKPLGIDVPVLAWGLGIDRFAMVKLGIKDIRDLFSHDLKFLREVKI